jgi:hypothetical protein
MFKGIAFKNRPWKENVENNVWKCAHHWDFGRKEKEIISCELCH